MFWQVRYDSTALLPSMQKAKAIVRTVGSLRNLCLSGSAFKFYENDYNLEAFVVLVLFKEREIL